MLRKPCVLNQSVAVVPLADHCDVIPAGTFHGRDAVPTGTFHGGDEVPPGTFHGGIETPMLPEPVGTDDSRESLINMPLIFQAVNQQLPQSIQAPSPRHISSRNNRSSSFATYQRVEGAYDLEYLADCRVVYVGCGGAAAFAETMARAGVGEHVLIDGDVVSESNIATQQVYRKDIGRHKVDCIADRLADINPTAGITAYCNMLNDFTDEQFEELLLGPMPYRSAPKRILLCGLTDSFPAQARINRLALKFGLPSLCAQVYHEGRGAEVTFTFPGVTAACHRCMLSSRYRAYLEEGFENNVTSHGTPLCSTSRLNALKEHIAIGILHHGTGHPRWGGLLEEIGNRNLIQIRMVPNLALPVFGRVFGGGDSQRILFDETVWLPQQPECPENGYPTCPDCGGSGDLTSVKGAIADTSELLRTASMPIDETRGPHCSSAGKN